jgi:hypothetical protein
MAEKENIDVGDLIHFRHYTGSMFGEVTKVITDVPYGLFFEVLVNNKPLCISEDQIIFNDGLGKQRRFKRIYNVLKGD